MKYRDNVPEEPEASSHTPRQTAAEIADRHREALELPEPERPEL